ncbi:hypothetical protein [Arthrobacter alpinus]|uniref:hypothetical protein n=1 Tax=Arthrobacter alpinus TaxID=656366 RepID=UPI0012FCC4FD|nr:hypothetical protein [Arthrobacter alpinus]
MNNFQLHTTGEVGAIFRCSSEHVRSRARSGKWPHLKDGHRYLFSQAQVEEIYKSMIVHPPLPSRRGQRGRIDALLRTVSSAQIDKAMARIG